MWGILKEIYYGSVSHYIKRGALTNGNLTRVSMLNAKGITWKKMNISFIVHFCLDKVSVYFLNKPCIYHCRTSIPPIDRIKIDMYIWIGFCQEFVMVKSVALVN